MLNKIVQHPFMKDVKRYQKKHYNFSKMEKIIKELASEMFLGSMYHNHSLVGNYAGYEELHIESDVLLIYKRDNENLYLFRLGSHDDLFE